MPDRRPSLALVAGSWSTNIGNAFYNLGAEWLLRRLPHTVHFFPESPRWKQDVPHHYDAVADLDVDLVVLNGPCLWERLESVYGDTFRRLYQRGIRVGYLSAGMATYTEAEARQVATFLNRFPPAFVSTRDAECHSLLVNRLECPVHNGICTSMFLNDALQPAPLRREPYVVFNFDDEEPSLSIDEAGRATVERRRPRSYPTEVRGLPILRTSNLPMDSGYRRIYERPHTYHSDLPGGYCSILAHAHTVYSERVHTCATALAYGRPAQFITVSGRSHEPRKLLFHRLGIPEIFHRPVQLDPSTIAADKAALTAFLSTVV